MPSTSSRNLTLTTIDQTVRVRVTYQARFAPLERFLAANGMQYRERIDIVGSDPDGSTTGTVLRSFPAEVLPVTGGAGPLTLSRDRTLSVRRQDLQEDAAPGDSDSIRCRITIIPVGLPARTRDFTDEEVLLG
jgi:hypothetical protein